MDVLGPPAAERATCRDPTRPKGEGDRGSNRIEVPGFEPNAAVRQKAREKVHPPLFGDPSPDHQKWPRAHVIVKVTIKRPARAGRLSANQIEIPAPSGSSPREPTLGGLARPMPKGATGR